MHVMTTTTRLINEAFEIIEQLKIAILELEQHDYNCNLTIVDGNTIGMHVRHILEFYKSLEKGAELNLVDYDARERNLELETNKLTAIKEIERIQNWLQTIVDDSKIEILHQSQKDMVLTSSMSRELAYNLEHAIQHMAIIKICIKHSFPYVRIEENFGVAYATIQYRALTNVHSKLSA